MPESAIEIRPVRRDELPIVQRLAHAIWHVHYRGIISADQIDYMLARGYATPVLAEFLDGDDRGLELAVADREPVAFAAWTLIHGTREAKLDKLYVLPALQRKGLGGRLIGRVVARARSAGAATLILNVNKNNTQAIRAYEKHDFAVRESVVNDIGNGFVMDDYVMAKDI